MIQCINYSMNQFFHPIVVRETEKSTAISFFIFSLFSTARMRSCGKILAFVIRGGGRMEIAHPFIGGDDKINARSPCNGRLMNQNRVTSMIQPSVSRTPILSFTSIPGVKRWAIFTTSVTGRPALMKQDSERKPHQVPPVAASVTKPHRVVVHTAPNAHAPGGANIEAAAQGHREAVFATLQKHI